MLKRTLTALALSCASIAAFTQQSKSENAILENEYVKAGVNETTGTFGSGNNTSPGLLYDSTGSGTFNTSYDYLTPGSPFDGFSVKIDGTNYFNNNAGNVANITGGWTSGTTTSSSSADWTGTFTHDSSTWTLRNQYSLPTGQQFIDIITSITAGSSASTVYFGRYIDPDARAAAGDSSSTDNVLGYSGIPATNVAFSEALSSRYALGLYTTNSNVTAGVQNWTQEADGYNGTVYGDGVNYGRGDDTIGLSWVWSGVTAGDVITARYSYIFGPSAFAAADEAISAGAGGGTAGETPEGWGEVADVGSATDAAESGGSTPAPTVVGVTTTTLTHHDVADNKKVQTVDRTLYTASADVYSDGSTGDVTTTETSLPRFSARVDQYDVMDDINSGMNRAFVTNPWRRGGAKEGSVEFFLNGNYGTSSSGTYEGTSKGIGVTAIADVDPNWKIGISVDSVATNIEETNSKSELKKLRVGLSSIYTIDDIIFTTDLNYSKNDYKVNRTIYIWDNNSMAEGYDVWVHQRAYYKLHENILPFVGVNAGKGSRDGINEGGYFLSARSIEKNDETYAYGEGGLRFMDKIGDLNGYIQVGYSTDQWISGDAGVFYDINKTSSIGVTIGRTQDDNETNINKVMIEGKINF